MTKPCPAPSSRRHPTLVRKLLWSVLPVVVLSLFVVGISNYLVVRNQIRRDIRNEIQTIAEQVAVNVGVFVEQRHRDLATLSETPLLADYYMNVEYGLHQEAQMYRGELQRYFMTFADRTGVYDLVMYFDTQGKLVAGVEGASVLEQDSYPGLDIQKMRGEGVYRSPIQAHDDHKRITLAKPLIDEHGKDRGTIVMVCNLRPLEGILEKTRVGRVGRAYLKGPMDQPLVGTPPKGKSDLRQEVEIAGTPWRVAVEAISSDFTAPLVRLRDLTMFFSFLVALLVSAILIVVIRRATRPIHEMAAGTRQLAAGNLEYRFPMPPIRDMEVLAVAFNEMAANLKVRDEQLKSRVRQLTALRAMEGTVTQRLGEESILRTCLKAVARGLDLDRTGLYWVDEQRGEVVGRYAHFSGEMSFSEQAFRKRSVPLGGEDILNQVIRGREAVLVSHPDKREGVDPQYVQEAGTNGFIMAPLCGKDRVFGVITADNCDTHRPLTESDKDGLMLFATAAGLAMENAMLIERIAESEARHRMVLENSPVAILGLSRTQRITTWNRGAETIFGYPAEQVIGKPLTALFPQDAEEQFNRLVMEVVEKGSVREYPIPGRTRSEEQLDLTVSWGGEERDFWQNNEWAVVIRDVTEARKLQRQLILSEKLSAVGQLISGIAHELNNPLQAVVGYAQLLDSPGPGRRESAEQDIRHIHENAMRCRRIIDNLLLFVRHGDVTKRTVSVEQAARASLELLEHKITKAARVEVKTDFPEAPLHVQANFQQIEQVFINLINNACDAMESWDGLKEIHIRVSATGRRVRVELADTGPGIPPEVRERLFEPFFTTKGEGRGTGLGLPLCRQIVEEHGGELEICGREGGGTLFFFELPIVECEAETASADSGNPGDSGDPRGPGAGPQSSTGAMTVLLVEDEASVRALLRDVLEAEGHRVEEAASIEAAAERAASSAFDMVVTDIHLGDGTGVEFFQQWGRWSGYPRPGFLFLTGDLVSDSLERMCEESGMRVLQKPVDLRELRSVIASFDVKQQSPAPLSGQSH